MSIDVEEWFHILETKNAPKFEDWNKFTSRVEIVLPRLLELLYHNNTKATFFFLGWIAEKYPNLVRMVNNQGHEIAIHGYSHELIYNQTQEEFYNDIVKAKNILENITGNPVIGYRAPGFSITPKTLWAYKVLTELDIKYSSSVFPARRAHGTFTDFNLSPVIIDYNNKSIVEFPQTVIDCGLFRFSCFGGGYLRISPLFFFNLAKKIISNNKRPLILYLHPRDIDKNQPRLQLNAYRMFKSYININKTEEKLKHIIKTEKFIPFRQMCNNTDYMNSLKHIELVH